MNAPQRRSPRAECDGRSPESTPATTLPEQLSQIYEEQFDFVWRNARRLGIPASSAEDVVQDVFVVLHRRLGDFRGGPIRPWIFGILARVVRDYKRAHRRKAARWVQLSPDAAPSPEEAQHNPSDLAERAERLRLLDSLLEQLSEDQRTLLVLSELEEWTLREIAEFRGSNISAVYSRLRAAKQRFEKLCNLALAKLGVER